MNVRDNVYVRLDGGVERLFPSQRPKGERRYMSRRQVNERALRVATEIAKGDLRRLRVMEDGSVLVHNHRR
jgi:hypothetical protein